LQPGDIMLHPETGSSFQYSSGDIGIGSMSLPLEDFATVGAVIAGSDLAPPRDALTLTPKPAAMAKLQRLHADAGYLAETAPEIIAHPEAARALEQSLIEALIGCVAEPKIHEERVAQQHHELVMRRFHRIVEENPGTPLYILEMCTTIGVSARTLLACCQEHLGMGPKQYLLWRRLQLVRRALRDAVPGTTTVTEIFTQYGFWQFGRFAGLYKTTFGERPSDTLRHRAG
jgi:transcriptional regulator GlxA family with amidase domain